jgi:hypothetical protein
LAQGTDARAITNREVISAAVEDRVQRDRHQLRDRRGEPGLAALPAASGVQRMLGPGRPWFGQIPARRFPSSGYLSSGGAVSTSPLP